MTNEETMHALRSTFVFAGLALLLAGPATAQSDWNWNGTLRPGQTIEIKGVNGSIRAVSVPGGEVRVVAAKHARRDDPDDVRMEVVTSSRGITICAVYPSRNRGQPNECRAGSGGRMSVNNNDVKVDFTVQVPRGVHFTGRNVNGGIEAEGLTGDVNAATVNGGIEVVTAGTVRAHTVNGSIDAVMGRADWSGTVEFETVNGGIRVVLPEGANADVSASTVNGDISDDFGLEVRGRWGPKRASGTIGSGGRELSLSTVNGRIEIRRR